MASAVLKSNRNRAAARKVRTVVYHGIKIEPMTGKRSPVAQYLRDALKSKSEKTRGEPARA
jgi:hypothetical protein